MQSLATLLHNPKKRRTFSTFASGGLIVLGLAAWHGLGLRAWGDGLMIAAALLAGHDVALRAWNSLRHRHVSIELLVTVAATGALAIGEYWEAAAVTFLFVFGAYLEARTLSRTRQVLGDLLDMAPARAIVVREGEQVEVLPHEVRPGETVLVKPGGKIAVDGDVIEGRSAVDESAITGEPMPEDKGPGDAVYAGTVNQDGLLRVRATGVGADTTLARIIRRVEEAQEEKAPTQQFIERFARWYTPFIIGLSAFVFAITRDLELALTLLVIGCPGALVISTPVSVVAGIGRAAKSGILIKGGEYLENAGKISALALDKTGTLTQGKPRVTEVIPLWPELVAEPAGVGLAASRLTPARATESLAVSSGNGHGRWSAAQAEVLTWAAVAEAGSEHPLARAIVREAETLGKILLPADFEARPGRGVRATYQGHVVAVGTPEWVGELSVAVDEQAQSHLARLKSAGRTAVVAALDGTMLGVLGISDPLRAAAPGAVRRLKELGLERVVMLTGDDRRTAETIAREAGIEEVRAELLPDDKLDAIRELQRQGHVVAMLGDGINDAPALAAADIGIAMGAAGTGIAIETADVALMADDLAKLPEALRLSRATLRNIHQNVVIALVTVTALLTGVLLGRVHMAGGMLVHEASVMLVIFNAMRLLRSPTR
jgi:Cd2+/Zn2+-exporting ATPase